MSAISLIRMTISNCIEQKAFGRIGPNKSLLCGKIRLKASWQYNGKYIKYIYFSLLLGLPGGPARFFCLKERFVSTEKAVTYR